MIFCLLQLSYELHSILTSCIIIMSPFLLLNNLLDAATIILSRINLPTGYCVPSRDSENLLSRSERPLSMTLNHINSLI